MRPLSGSNLNQLAALELASMQQHCPAQRNSRPMRAPGFRNLVTQTAGHIAGRIIVNVTGGANEPVEQVRSLLQIQVISQPIHGGRFAKPAGLTSHAPHQPPISGAVALAVLGVPLVAMTAQISRPLNRFPDHAVLLFVCLYPDGPSLAAVSQNDSAIYRQAKTGLSPALRQFSTGQIYGHMTIYSHEMPVLPTP